MENNIRKNAEELLEKITAGNAFGERVTLVAATKTRTPEEIGIAVRAGIGDVGENRVQEFCAKYDLVQGARWHFIGRLQTNKVKYLIGKTFLIHSVDRDELAATIAAQSVRANLTTDVLVQINIGAEESKGGYPPEAGLAAFRRLARTDGLRVKGFMAMLPLSDDAALLGKLCDRMRALFEEARAEDPRADVLSMGMSGDWELCLEHGANMIRLGTAIFGERNANFMKNGK